MPKYPLEILRHIPNHRAGTDSTFSSFPFPLNYLFGGVISVFRAELLEDGVPTQTRISAHVFEHVLRHGLETRISALRHEHAVDPENHLGSRIIDHEANWYIACSEEEIIDIFVGFKHLA